MRLYSFDKSGDIRHNRGMPDNFTPLPSSVAHGKGAVDVNSVLIIVAVSITILLGGLMWFLIVQKQTEENQAAMPTSTTPVTTEVVPGDEERITPTASNAAMLLPTATPSATLEPQASPSAIITR